MSVRTSPANSTPGRVRRKPWDSWDSWDLWGFLWGLWGLRERGAAWHGAAAVHASALRLEGRALFGALDCWMIDSCGFLMTTALAGSDVMWSQAREHACGTAADDKDALGVCDGLILGTEPRFPRLRCAPARFFFHRKIEDVGS